jgi:hypothetical protein
MYCDSMTLIYKKKRKFLAHQISGEKPFKGGREREHYVFIIEIYKN